MNASRLPRSLFPVLTASLLLVSTATFAQDTPDIPAPPTPTSSPPKGEASDRGQKPTDAPTETQAAPEVNAPAASAPAAASAEPVAQVSAAPKPAEPSRARHHRKAPSLSGDTGLLRVGSAYGAAPRTIRIGLGLDWFSKGGVIEEIDELSRFGATLTLSGSPIDYLELWLGWRAQSTTSNLTDPGLLQAMGDLTFGARGYYPIVPSVSLGADVALTFVSGIGDNSIDFGSTLAKFRLLGSFDFQKAADIPLVGHVNLGMIADGSENLATEPLTVSERFAFGISNYHRFTAGFGVEVPVPYVTPYLEYTLEVPLGYVGTPGIVLEARQRAGLVGTRAAGQTAVNTVALPAVQRVMPQRLTPGVRVTAIPDLTLDLALEIGLTPDTASGVVPVAPFNLIFLASYVLDPFSDKTSGPPIVVPVLIPEIKEAPPAAPETGTILGRVKSQVDGRPVADAIVIFDRGTPVATGADGRFVSPAMEPGPVKVTVRREGFKPALADLEVVLEEQGAVEMVLVPDVKRGVLRGRVTDAKGAAIAKAKLELIGPERTTIETNASGVFEAKLLEGTYQLLADTDGFFRLAKRTDVLADTTSDAQLVLRARPTNPIVDANASRVILKRSIYFRGRTAELSDRDKEVLAALVDLLLTRTDVKRIRVESHVDRANPDADTRLTQERAETIKAYIVENGVDESRVDAVGMGSEKPRAPNVTPRARDENKRVEISVIQ